MFDKTKEELLKEIRDIAREMVDKRDYTNRYRLTQIRVELACLGCRLEDVNRRFSGLSEEERSNWGHTVDVEGLAEFARKTVEYYGLVSGQEDISLWIRAATDVWIWLRNRMSETYEK